MSAEKCPTVIFAAAVLSALSATNPSAGIPCNLLAGGIEACQEQIADATERLNQASGWLAQLEANAKTKPYLDPDDQSELQEAKNDVATRAATSKTTSAILTKWNTLS